MRATLPPGIHVLERGWLSSNSIVFQGPEGTAVVDSGYVSHAPQTVALVDGLLLGRPLDRLINTHLHSDHCGGNAALRARYPSLRIAIPPGEAAAVREWDSEQLSYRATGQDCPRFAFDELLRPGGALTLAGASWEVHAAPGHDPHSVILFEPDSRVLISADALWERGFGVVFPEMRGEPGFDEVAATLDLIERLAPLTVIPGHGGVFKDVPVALAHARARIDAFIKAPDRHARHALKVLIKFKLLDARRMARPELLTWLGNAPYFEQVRARFMPQIPLAALCEELVADLARSGALQAVGDQIIDQPQ